MIHDLEPTERHQIPGRGLVFVTEDRILRGALVRVDGIIYEVIGVEMMTNSPVRGLIARKLSEQPPAPERAKELDERHLALVDARSVLVEKYFDEGLTPEEEAQQKKLEDEIDEVEQELWGWTLEPLKNRARNMETLAQGINDFLSAMGIDATS